MPCIKRSRKRFEPGAQKRRERRRLHGRRHVRRDRRRGAVVDIRRPHVERDGGDLETEPNEQQRDADEEQRTTGDRSTLRQRALSDRLEVRGPRRAIHESDTIEQERRREGAKQEVLERTLGGANAPSIDAGERVHGDRHQLDTEEHDHEVARRREQHHA